MSVYIEYTLDDGSTILVETEEVSEDVVKASRGGVDVVKAGKNFTDALANIRSSLRALIMEMDSLQVGEAEVKFGLKAVGEAGVFAVGKVGGEMNYEIILKWKKPEEKSRQKTRR
jgi:hypothetical protein